MCNISYTNAVFKEHLQQRKLYPWAEFKTSCKTNSDVMLVNILAATCSSKTQLSIYCFHSQYILCNREMLDKIW